MITTVGVLVGCMMALAVGYWLSHEYQLPRVDLYYLVGGRAGAVGPRHSSRPGSRRGARRKSRQRWRRAPSESPAGSNMDSQHTKVWSFATDSSSQASKRMTLPVGNSELRASLANQTVLVIDDNEAVCTAFDVLLSLHGMRVLTASAPGAGARRARARSRRSRDPGHELPPRGDARRGRHGAVPRDPRAAIRTFPSSCSRPGRTSRRRSSW